MIIAEDVKLIPYLNNILDKEMVINVARKSCTAVKEDLNKNPMDTTINTMNLLNTLLEEDLRTMRIKVIITVIT